MICFLHPDPSNNTYYDKEDVDQDPDLTPQVTRLSSEMVVAIQRQK